LLTSDRIENSDQNLNELNRLLQVLPDHITAKINSLTNKSSLLEVILDLGRLPEARFTGENITLNQEPITSDDLDNLVQKIGFIGEDNRAGIEGTLHRVSVIRSRRGHIVGATCRVGRAINGSAMTIEDLIQTGQNILLLGRPGVGKTTMLRETARMISDDLSKRVVIVDTSNEIAGDGDVPHPAIGSSRRMQVASPKHQHAVMIEAVENHMPEVIIIDEMSTTEESDAARTIAERGVQLVATAHGNTLENLIFNPTLSDLVGGIQSVTLGDQEAKFRGTQKTIQERKSWPTFDIVVEIKSWNEIDVHDNVAEVVDQWLRGYAIYPESRVTDENGELVKSKDTVRQNQQQNGSWDMQATKRTSSTAQIAPNKSSLAPVRKLDYKVFLFGVSKDKILAAQEESNLTLTLSNELRNSDIVLTTKTHYRRGSNLVKSAESTGTPVYVLRKNTFHHILDFLSTLAKEQGIDFNPIQRSQLSSPDTNSSDILQEALKEAEDAANEVLSGTFSVLLNPQRSYVRRLQHIQIDRMNLSSISKGKDPNRALLVYRT
jgi:stage III sporulation protein SpoIIIAA|tara:strand:- start:1722 stop:3365 length:1644 start_codon:yes stop_codon:yes gene_type:complete